MEGSIVPDCLLTEMLGIGLLIEVMSSRIHIGTSGWNYGHWKGIFYPDEVKSRDLLSYYSKHFSTVEVNYSFYRLPRATTYEGWSAQTPEGFLFAVKVSRYITHIKRLKGVKRAWRRFVKNAEPLGVKRGPILVQFPPNFHSTNANQKLLRTFLQAAKEDGVNVAVEFRHDSWFAPEAYAILEEAKASLVIANSSRYSNPPEQIATADFVYFRFHGPQDAFASSYTREELQRFAKIIKEHHRRGREVYAYFNNDIGGHALENATTLKELVSS